MLEDHRTAADHEDIDGDSATRLIELAAEFVDRAQRGECLTIEEFADRNADLRDEILELFPTILSLEELKQDASRPSDGRISLCGRRIERLGEFQILREIGRGGMGVVFEAVQLSLGRLVAVKVFPKRLVHEADIRCFEQEAKIASRLHHTNIVPIYAYGCQEGVCYFAMQRIEGRSLDQLMRRNLLPRFDQDSDFVRWVADVGIQVASALDYAHQQQVVHRDIKPANLMIDQYGAAWITDFGLAHAFMSDLPEVTAHGGTAAYSPPELQRGECEVRSDVYSLSVTLRTLLEEGLRRGVAQTTTGRKSRRPLLPDRKQPIPPEVRAILAKAAAHKPSNRYCQASDLADDLRKFRSNHPVSAYRESWLRRLRKWSSRNPALAAACTLICGMAVTTIAVLSVSYVNIARLNVDLEKKNARLARTFFAVDALLHSSATGQKSLRRDDLLSLADFSSDDARSLRTETATHLIQILPDLTMFEQSILDDPRSLATAVNMRRRVGRWLHAAGRTAEAERSFLYAKEIIPESLSPADVGKNQGVLAIQEIRLDNDLACVYDSLLQFPLAESYRHRALKNLEQLESEAGSVAVAYDLSRTIHGLVQQHKVLEPVRLFQRHATPGDGEPPAFRPMNVGIMEFQRLNRAIELLRESIREDAQKISRPLLLAECLFERAAYPPGEPNRQAADIREGLQLLYQLIDSQPSNWSIRADCIRVLTHYPVRIESHSTEADARAIEHLQAAARLAEQMARHSPALTDIPGYRALAQYKIGLLTWRETGPEAALFFLQESVALLKELTEDLATDVRYRVWCAVARATLAINLQQLDRSEEAADVYQAALKEFEKIDTEPRFNDAVRQSEQIVRSAHFGCGPLQEADSDVVIE